jgi:hypothetical protein
MQRYNEERATEGNTIKNRRTGEGKQMKKRTKELVAS